MACFLQNGAVIRDDVHGCRIPSIEKFKNIVDVENTWPLTFVEQWSLTEVTAELSTSCYAGVLMLRAMGLGGWMFNGMDPFSVLGASGNPAVPGLGFRFDADERWPYPNPTGLAGMMEGYCPPHFRDMRAAVEALCERKFGPVVVSIRTPRVLGRSREKSGPPPRSTARSLKNVWRSKRNTIFDRFGKFPGTVPSMIATIYLQAHHLDLEFYDDFFESGAYLRTHADHMARWHGAEVRAAPQSWGLKLRQEWRDPTKFSTDNTTPVTARLVLRDALY